MIISNPEDPLPGGHKHVSDGNKWGGLFFSTAFPFFENKEIIIN
jgi:hypothetical protein